jgi:hypothetical protein
MGNLEVRDHLECQDVDWGGGGGNITIILKYVGSEEREGGDIVQNRNKSGARCQASVAK